MVYPFYESLQNLSRNMVSGNFGLWYNKFIPIKDFDSCKASDERGNDNNAVSCYERKYSGFNKDETEKLLKKKHLEQGKFCEAFSLKYEHITITARLKTPIITGIGESHPHEVSMVFDHNMGIPYIPASGIKGIVRVAHILGLLDTIPPEKIKTDEKSGRIYFDDEESWTNVPQLFGTQAARGSAIFLDAYPENIPDLHVDIMNPHYGEYYNDDTNRKPPADYLNPVPLKFLTVAKGTVFVFRALVDKKYEGLTVKVRAAFISALTEEGVGAKTAVGYGFFENLKEEEPAFISELIKKEKVKDEQKAKEADQKAEAERLGTLSKDDKMLEEINSLKNDTSQISSLVKKCFEGSYSKSVFIALKEKLEGLGEWKPAGSKKRKDKMTERNSKIEAKIAL